jgi:SAM-dependent methyltransferase
VTPRPAQGNPEDESYGAVTARFYDAAYAALGNVGPDADFYRRLARESGGPVLELGCGTGRVLLPIAAEGLDCVGLDASAAMLDALRAKPGAAALELVCARMQDFDLRPRRFALVFSAFRAFQHLCRVEEQLCCLARVREHLAPGGVFAFDVFNPRLDRLAQPEEPEAEDVRFALGSLEVVRHVSARRDAARQVLHVAMRYECRDGGRLVGEERAVFDMRWFHRFELEHLLQRAGFARVEILGDFDGSPVAADSPALVALARSEP